MNEQARRIWEPPEGAGLLRQMLAGGPLDAQGRRTLDELKRADPPKPTQGQRDHDGMAAERRLRA